MTSKSTKPRLHEFDMLKGVAIFLVVMGHVLTFCVREIDRAPLFKFIGQIHMPLFFFVSGWFTMKVLPDGLRVSMPKLLPRAKQLLLPMVVVSSLWVVYYPHSGLQSPLESGFGGLWSAMWKNGYWFTLSLFELVLIYSATVPLLSRMRNAAMSVIATICVWAVILLVFFNLDRQISNYLCLEQVATYYPAFMFGALGRRYITGFRAALSSNVCQTIAMLGLGFTMYVNCWYWEFSLSPLDQMISGALLHICLAIVCLPVFEQWSAKAYSADATPLANGCARLWEYLGSQSLAIYLLHYFFLFPMGDVARPWLEAYGLSFIPCLLFAAAWSIPIIACVLGVVKLLSPSPTLSLLLTGKK